MSMPLGETACLGAALLWAVSVQIFAGPIARHGARTVNLFKCTLATVLLGITLLASGGWGTWDGVSAYSLMLVALSGIVGLTIGDTALFSSVNHIGPHRSLLLQTTAPIFAVGLAVPMGERLSGGQWLGASVILVGIVIVLTTGESAAPTALSRHGFGVAMGLLAACGQGAGVVIAKAGMASVPVLHATFVRLGIGAIGLVAMGLVTGKLRPTIQASTDRKTLPRLVVASFFGTYLAMLLMMVGVARSPASVAAVLLATPPIFSIVIEAIIHRKRPSTGSLIGTVVAVAGVALLATSG